MGIGDHVEVLIAVGLICAIWFLFDEVIFRLGEVATSLSAGTPGVNVIGMALNFWRIFPFIIIIGAFLWALLKSSQDEAYTYPTQA